jgi:hypothetical protein
MGWMHDKQGGFYKTASQYAFIGACCSLCLCVAQSYAIDHAEITSMTDLSVSKAEELAKEYGGTLHLNSLKRLSPDAAKQLTKHRHGLSLNGLVELTPETAAALGQYPGNLSLNGLVDLSPEAAKSLATHEGDLELLGLQRLSEKTAKELVRHTKRKPRLDNVTQLDAGAAAALVAWDRLELWKLADLSPETARALATSKEDVSLPAVEELSPEVAAALGQFKGSVLSLGGLKKLTPEGARSLAKFKGRTLVLATMLEVIDLETAQELTKFQGDNLILDGLNDEKMKQEVVEFLKEFGASQKCAFNLRVF